MATVVLIPRANLDAPAVASDANIQGLKINDLDAGLIYSWLRKPDFQRETASWSPEQVTDLITTFARGNIIPAVVLWQNGQNVFVIDGAHRLSALIAWVRNDYGFGDLSAKHYGNVIPDYQKQMHATTKDLVETQVNSYRDHRLAAENPKGARPEILERASKFAFRNIEIQWIRNASVEQAKAAFFRINQGGVKIDSIETRILRANSSAVAIGARAITHAGTGHDYWERFDEQTSAKIVSLGGDISKLLFSPSLAVPINTLDVPVAGFGYGSHVLPFAFDLINMSNELALPDSTRKGSDNENIPNDPDGKETIRQLSKVKELIQLLSSKHPGSLGLHPALYFYSPRGEFTSAAFFSIASWFADLDRKKNLLEFVKVREKFERLIIDHPVIVKPALHKLGTGGRTRPRMVALFEKILDLLSKQNDTKKVWDLVIAMPEFEFLLSDHKDQQREMTHGAPGAKFPRRAKTAGFLRQALPQALKCPLCEGIMHVNGMTSDHVVERSQGGTSADQNSRSVHPICNSNRSKIQNSS